MDIFDRTFLGLIKYIASCTSKVTSQYWPRWKSWCEQWS